MAWHVRELCPNDVPQKSFQNKKSLFAFSGVIHVVIISLIDVFALPIHCSLPVWILRCTHSVGSDMISVVSSSPQTCRTLGFMRYRGNRKTLECVVLVDTGYSLVEALLQNYIFMWYHLIPRTLPVSSSTHSTLYCFRLSDLWLHNVGFH